MERGGWAMTARTAAAMACHVCAALLVEGRVRQDGEIRDHGELFTALPNHWRTACCSGTCARPGRVAVRKLACSVSECVDVGGDVWRVRLRAPAGKPRVTTPGSTLMIEREGGKQAAFSLASAPRA